MAAVHAWILGSLETVHAWSVGSLRAVNAWRQHACVHHGGCVFLEQTDACTLAPVPACSLAAKHSRREGSCASFEAVVIHHGNHGGRQGPISAFRVL